MESIITYLGYVILVIGIILLYSIKANAKVDEERTKPSGGEETEELQQWHNESDKAIYGYALSIQLSSSFALLFLIIGVALFALKDLFF